MATTKKLMGTTAAAADGALAIEDVFSTYLYTGDGTTSHTITNGIDLDGEGGLVWIKERTDANSHWLTDTERGVNSRLATNLTNAENASTNTVTSFNSNGFTVGENIGANRSSRNYTSWTFRKAPRFFDVVTYTGTSADQTINHSLDADVGAIFIKSLDNARYWWCTHRRLNNGTNWWQYDIHLNDTLAESTETFYAFMSEPTSTSFTLRGGKSDVNANGENYVAYLFAHDPLGPSGDGSDGLIACGSYSGTGADGNYVNIGWEPQWLLLKRTDDVGLWWLIDNMRGMTALDVYGDAYLFPHTSAAEGTGGRLVAPNPNGFTLANGDFNRAGTDNYIYIAIRRGPMRQPTSGTEVFEPSTALSSWDFGVSVSTSFPIDLIIQKSRGSAENWTLFDRMRGGRYLSSNTTSAETSSAATFGQDFFSLQSNISANAGNRSFNVFRRAPGFFDVVAYTGNGVAGLTVPHNLGVAPEMMIVKRRDGNNRWGVYHKGLNANGDNAPETDYIVLNENWAASDRVFSWNDTAPTDTHFTLGTGGEVANNASGQKGIAYLFATLPGVSKVGSYTGNGSSQTIDCGFTSGARFVLIKRTDSTGDWYVWDTERGIVAANDPHLSLNTTAVEVTTDDSIDPDSSGFIVNQVAATNINVSSASYIFLAIA